MHSVEEADYSTWEEYLVESMPGPCLSWRPVREPLISYLALSIIHLFSIQNCVVKSQNDSKFFSMTMLLDVIVIFFWLHLFKPVTVLLLFHWAHGIWNGRSFMARVQPSRIRLSKQELLYLLWQCCFSLLLCCPVGIVMFACVLIRF